VRKSNAKPGVRYGVAQSKITQKAKEKDRRVDEGKRRMVVFVKTQIDDAKPN
jgi:hypothetical protein